MGFAVLLGLRIQLEWHYELNCVCPPDLKKKKKEKICEALTLNTSEWDLIWK